MDLNDDILLKVNNLETSFKTEHGTVKAVKGINFTLKKGETIGIVGESGSGKSVTSLSIMKLISKPGKITGGNIFFNNDGNTIDLVNMPNKEMKKIRGKDISMIFQEPMTSLNPVYTCGAQISETILLHYTSFDKKMATAMALELFDMVQLPDPERILNAYPHEISGGQKQRVMIAMAMACNPSLLIADEPTTALDVTVQAHILDLMKKLRDENETSIMFITHDLGVIAEIADRVMVMYKGNIVEEGSVWDIFSNPQHPYTKGLLACRPRLDMTLKRLPTVNDFMEVDASGSIIEKKINVGEAIIENAFVKEELLARQKHLMAQEPVLKVKGLKVHFPVKKGLFNKVIDFNKAVDDVSFDVYPGETLGLVGESGCGKTTTGRAIVGLEKPTEGEIFYKGKDIALMSETELRNLRKEIQIIFQDPYSSLNPRMTIGSAIMEPMKVHGVGETRDERKERALALLEKVGMEREHFNRYPHEFSGGQRQRISIARALSVNPQFIICDESVSALDVSVQAQVLNLLNQLQEELNLTYIFISHDLSVVKFMSDRILVMNKGIVEESGYPEEIYTDPKSEYTKKLINAIPKGSLDVIKEKQLKRKLQQESKKHPEL